LPQRKRTGSPKSPDATDAIVGTNIRIQRLQKGMSQSELADGLGVSFQQVQKYEKGTNRIGSGRLSRIADVPVTALFEGVATGRARRAGSSVLRLIADRQAIRLVQAFARVENRVARRSIVTLVERVAVALTSKSHGVCR
jgi:transcriptional regulator with XRE-family HTH domain